MDILTVLIINNVLWAAVHLLHAHSYHNLPPLDDAAKHEWVRFQTHVHNVSMGDSRNFTLDTALFPMAVYERVNDQCDQNKQYRCDLVLVSQQLKEWEGKRVNAIKEDMMNERKQYDECVQRAKDECVQRAKNGWVYRGSLCEPLEHDCGTVPYFGMPTGTLLGRALSPRPTRPYLMITKNK